MKFCNNINMIRWIKWVSTLEIVIDRAQIKIGLQVKINQSACALIAFALTNN